MATQSSEYYYPITKEYLDKFVSDIVNTVKSNSCITYMFNELVGGSRSWIKFIINNPKHTDLYNDLPNSKFAVFEASNCTEQSALSFLFELLKSIEDAYGTSKKTDYNTLSVDSVLNNIKSLINKIPNNEKLVIFAIKIDSFQNMNATIGNLIYSIWKDNKDKISFITTFSKPEAKEGLKSKFGLFFEAISNKIVDIKRVSDEDIRHSVRHWSYKLNHTYSDKEIETIIKYSSGYPYISKLLAQELKSDIQSKNIDSQCKKVVQDHISNVNNDNLSINKQGNIIFLNGTDISRYFTYQEFSVLKLLIEKSGSIVNRDDIAFCLWNDKSFEKYSDWAIDKYISLIRTKLIKLNFSGTIKAKKGEGFAIVQK